MLNEHVSARTLGWARIIVFSLWLLNVNSVQIDDYAALPPELLSQHGVLRLLPESVFALMTTEAFGHGLRAVISFLLIWLILGLPRYTAIAIGTAVLLTLYDGLGKSLGHINHAKFAMLYAAWILAAFPAADGASLAPRSGRRPNGAAYAAPMMAIALVICTAYMFVGAFRIHEVGLDIFTSDTLQFWFVRRNLEHNPTGFTIGLWMAKDPSWMLLSNLGFAGGTALEALSPLCLFWRPFRILWVLAIVPFHFANLFTMNINFWHNSVLVLFFMTDIDRLIGPGELARLRARLGRGRSRSAGA